MGTDIAVINRELTARLPMFADVLPAGVSPQRLMRTVLMSCERNVKLLDCTPQSVINGAMTAAVLGLEVDGVTGQGFLIPYRVKGTPMAQFQVGYRGYNTIAARAGYSINGGIVREEDDFDFMLGTHGYVKHRPKLGNEKGRRIIAAWATSESLNRPSIVAVLSIDELEATKAKSRAAQSEYGDSPWKDPHIGYPAMCEKTAKRRLARSMPLSVMQLAHAFESRQDMGDLAYLEAGGQMRVVGESSAAPGPVSDGTIRDTQPGEILSPATAASKIRFPTFATLKAFREYSVEYFKSATCEQAIAWETNYRQKLKEGKESTNPDVRTVIDQLTELYDQAMRRDT